MTEQSRWLGEEELASQTHPGMPPTRYRLVHSVNPIRIGRFAAIAALVVSTSGCQSLQPRFEGASRWLESLAYQHVDGPSLNGTYRLIFDSSKGFVNGGLPRRVESDKVLWAFRSSCTQERGCIAAATALNPNDTNTAYAPAFTAVLRFDKDSGEWGSWPSNVPVINQGPCLGPGYSIVGPTPVKTAERLWLKPEADGTLSGTLAATGLSNECGTQGRVVAVPFTATRIGDTSSTVTVADPDTISMPARRETTPSPDFNGIYTLDAEASGRTMNGLPAPLSPFPTEEWAMRASCNTPTHCIATGSRVDSPYVADALVLESAGKAKWQSASPRIVSVQCIARPASQTSLLEWEIDAESGVGTITRRALTGECGEMGVVTTMPIRFRKTGESPKDGVIADPKLFLHWPS
jgi:hypothetical protein